MGRKTIIAIDEYYHIYNRGNDKQALFLDERDGIRFLFLILHFQSPLTFGHISRYVSYFVRHRWFNIEPDAISQKRFVELISFSIMPNHFHLIVRETKEGGMAEYLGRIQNAQTKYFNTKYKRTGHLFQGPYQAVHIEDNNQLLHLSAYIHKNATELTSWKNKEHLYPWSSYQDYLQNRWGELLRPDVILKQFDNSKEYQKFVKSSSAKEKLYHDHLVT